MNSPAPSFPDIPWMSSFEPLPEEEVWLKTFYRSLGSRCFYVIQSIDWEYYTGHKYDCGNRYAIFVSLYDLNPHCPLSKKIRPALESIGEDPDCTDPLTIIGAMVTYTDGFHELNYAGNDEEKYLDMAKKAFSN